MRRKRGALLLRVCFKIANQVFNLQIAPTPMSYRQNYDAWENYFKVMYQRDSQVLHRAFENNKDFIKIKYIYL